MVRGLGFLEPIQGTSAFAPRAPYSIWCVPAHLVSSCSTDVYKRQVVCGEILEIYRELYKIEKEIRDKESDQRLAARQDRSKPLTDKLNEKLLGLKDSLNPTNPLMKAVAYTLTHWDALVRFLDDQDFEVDNNTCEQAIKSWVIIRKNSLFCGSDAGGKAAAIHLSFVSSCNRLGIDPLKYLTDVYTLSLIHISSASKRQARTS